MEVAALSFREAISSMDANSLISNKRQKLHEGDRKNESSTRIIDLPNQVLQDIISFLPTKEAVQTSVLSKRWVYQWMNISKIDLEEGAPEKRQQFIDFVGKLLVVCNSSRIEKFSLVCEVGEDAALINEWLCGFINPKIQELNIDFERVEEPLIFPDHLFTCAALTKFQLSMQHVINLPSTICFESLRTLTLKHIVFPNSSSTQLLFTGCPFLEELTLIDCNWVNVSAVCISSPLLSKLIIREWKDDDDDDDSDYSDEENDDAGGENIDVGGENLNAGGVNVDVGGQSGRNYCQIVIVGTNLKSFSYDGDLINDYFLYSSNSVIDASVEVHPPDGCLGAGFFVFKLLKALSNVEKLSISDTAIEALGRTAYLLGHLPLFCNLAELRVVSVSSIDLSCEALLTILRKSPCLKVVNFVMGVSLPKDCAKRNVLNPLPTCFETHLKMIEICGFSGNEGELNAIKFLLQAASVLDTLSIYSNSYDFDSPVGPNKLEKLYERIVRFPRGSEDCEIDLE